MVLHDLTLYAKPGQKLALSVRRERKDNDPQPNLINRFYDVQDGKIRYDDININKIKRLICEDRLVSFFKIHICLRERLWKTFVTGNWMQQMRKFIRQAELAHADGFIRECFRKVK